MTRPAVLALAAALLVAARLAPVQAQTQAQLPSPDRPAALPTRDVDVTYRTEQAGQVIEQRSRFDAATQRMRLDMPTPGMWSVMDYRAHTLAIVSDPDRGVLDMPAQPGAAPGTQPGTAGAFVRRGQDQVAGLPCTEWETRDSRGQLVLTCFTADGVMLRVRRGTAVLAVATRVAYGPMAPSLFVPPPGYGHVTPRASAAPRPP